MAITIPSQPGIDVFVNKEGTITIQQEPQGPDGDFQYVVLDPSNVDRFVESIQTAKRKALAR